MVLTLGARSDDFSVYPLRRRDLVNAIKQEYPECKTGIVVLFAAFENDEQRFRQESSFFYLTGLTDPSTVVIMDLESRATLYLPACSKDRSAWMYSELPLTPTNLKKLGIDQMRDLGKPCQGYQLHPYFTQAEYEHVLARMAQTVAAGGSIFTLSPTSTYEYVEQRFVLDRLFTFMPHLSAHVRDVSQIVARMRRKKDMREIEQLYKAIEITGLAQEAAAQSIQAGVNEAEVQAALEYMFTGSQALPAFPSIVGSGKNSTILHYHANSHVLKNGDLVVVDIGARYQGYCADITRTYPVSGTFNKRQRELYQMVLDTQEYIADKAKPGIWLKNKEKPDQSLHHLAQEFLDKKGYGKYFIHGIGHYLGLDVHDVGDYTEPLHEGDVFTIEPGIYIAQENIGIRIEDDYWVVKDGVVCLSESLPKKPNDIQDFMQDLEPDESAGQYQEEQELFHDDEDDDQDDEH